MIDYRAARAVFLVVQTGSFERAAKALGVTPSAVSQRVRGLEEAMGVVLVVRASPCTATEEGAWLCRHIEHVGLLEADLHARFPRLRSTDAATPVTLHLATNADSLGTWFLSAVAPFTRDSGVLLDIAVDDEDHTADWLRRGRVMAAVTSLEAPVQGCQVRALGRLRYHATASPGYMERHFPQGLNAAALGRAPALTFNQKDRLQQSWLHRQFGQEISFPSHWLPSSQGFVEATLAGMGWGLNPAQLVAGHLAAGRLVELLPGAVLDVPLFWQANRLAAGQLAPLTRAVVARAREVLV